MGESLDDLTRLAVFETWGQQCVWCGRPLFFNEMEVEHVLPKSLKAEERDKVLALHGLTSTFDLDTLENMISSCGPCNRDKGSKPPPDKPVIALILQRSKEKAPDVRRAADRFRGNRSIGRALSIVLAALDEGNQQAVDALREASASLSLELSRTTGHPVDRVHSALGGDIGAVGERAVIVEFERIGWASISNRLHDLGIDLLVEARDSRGFDLGLLVGVQVKSGSSFFEQQLADGSGWWFRGRGDKHFDAQLKHSLPQLVVLYDVEAKTSYWAAITNESVVRSEHGAKVFVPRANTIDEAHLPALLDVASAGKPGIAWEGSAWSSDVSLTSSVLLRHALIVPRLVAPHPNAGRDAPLSPERAIAMLMQARQFDLDRFALQQPDVPTLDEASASADWRWRFFSALGARALDGEYERLRVLLSDAPDTPSTVAAHCICAATFIENGQHNAAIEVLSPLIERNVADPVDHGWLLIQRARARAEVAQLDEARTDALAALTLRTDFPGDASARAIAGSAAALLFNTSGSEERQLAEFVSGADTAASWWRAQTTARALTAVVKRTFEGHMLDDRLQVGDGDLGHNELHGAALTASYAGDQGAWRHLARLLACDALLRLNRHADPAVARDALRRLVASGARDEVPAAVKRIRADGPCAAVTAVAADVDLAGCGRTTLQTNLRLLRSGGDVIDKPTAERAVTWLLAAVADRTEFNRRIRPAFDDGSQLIETLAAVVPAAATFVQRRVIESVLSLDVAVNQFHTALFWAKVVEALPSDAWTSETAARAREEAPRHHENLRYALLGVAARSDIAGREQLVDEARDGSLDAVRALGAVNDLPAAIAKIAIDTTANVVRGCVAAAERGEHSLSVDHLDNLAGLNVSHPTLGDWNTLVDALASPSLAIRAKRGAIVRLIRNHTAVPDLVTAVLCTVVSSIANQTLEPIVFGDDPDDGPAEAMVLATILKGFDEPGTSLALASLLNGGSEARRWAANLAYYRAAPEDVGLLAMLASDPDPQARATAASAVAALVATNRAGELGRPILEACLRDPGAEVPDAIATAMSGRPGKDAEYARELLRNHPSAKVRRNAAA